MLKLKSLIHKSKSPAIFFTARLKAQLGPGTGIYGHEAGRRTQLGPGTSLHGHEAGRKAKAGHKPAPL